MTYASSDLNHALARLHASTLSFKVRLAERIEALQASFAEQCDGRQPSPQSLEGLIDFLERADQWPRIS